MSEKTCLEATHVWIRYDQDHTPNGVCPLCSCIVKLREVRAERDQLNEILATRLEHDDTGPHEICTCALCTAEKQLASYRAALAEDQAGPLYDRLLLRYRQPGVSWTTLELIEWVFADRRQAAEGEYSNGQH